MTEYQRIPNTSCSICATLIYRRPAELERSSGNAFCSQKCYGLHCRKENPCIICGALILAGANKKTCSRTCANKHRTGISYKINRPRDKVTNLRSIKLRLIDERGAKCERCSYKVIQILQVHHKNRDRKNNSMRNLEIICPNCHAKEHYLEKSWLNGKS